MHIKPFLISSLAALLLSFNYQAQAERVCNPSSWEVIVKAALKSGLIWNGGPADCSQKTSALEATFTETKPLADQQPLIAQVTANPTRIRFKRGTQQLLCIEITDVADLSKSKTCEIE